MSIAMPRVRQIPSPNYSPTTISHDRVFVHMMEGEYAGSVAYLCLTTTQASAHLCMSDDGSEVSQLVPLQYKAWAEVAFNGGGVSLEIPGFTAKGIPEARWRSAALIVAWLCRAYAIPVQWAKGGQGRGICQHVDLGAAGGGHHDACGIGSPDWFAFLGYVKEAYDAFGDGPLPAFALHGAPGPSEAELPPAVTPAPSHGGAPRIGPDDVPVHETQSAYPLHTVADLQWKLDKLGASIKVDGLYGPETEAALRTFQAKQGCKMIDGLVGPESWAAIEQALSA